MAGGHGGKQRNSYHKKTISDLKQYKLQWFKDQRRIFHQKNIFQSWLAAKHEAGYQCSIESDSRHICYLLNIGGKFCFSLPEDLTVKDDFCIFMFVPCRYFCREIQIPRRGHALAHVMRLPLDHGRKINKITNSAETLKSPSAINK